MKEKYISTQLFKQRFPLTLALKFLMLSTLLMQVLYLLICANVSFFTLSHHCLLGCY